MKRTLIAAALIIGLGSTANAQEMISASKALEIVVAIRDMGYRALLEKDSFGDPMITSKASGLNYIIVFHECTDNKDCRSIQLSASFTLLEPTTADVMNEWNNTKRYGRAYLDEDNDPTISFDINMSGAGISKEAFNNSLDIWESLLSDFKGHIKF